MTRPDHDKPKSSTKKPSRSTHTPTIENRKARFRYHISSTVECGVSLHGAEVKSIRAGQVSLGEGYARVDDRTGELWLHNVHVAGYDPARGAALAPTPTRARKLLAHSREISRLAEETRAKGTTLVPLKMYFKDGWAKVLIGVAVGKQQHDKREDTKKREAGRAIQRAMSRKRI